MKSFSLLSIVYIVFNFLSFAQTPDTLWTTIIGGSNDDSGNFIQQTSDGGYVITGETKSFGAGANDVWLVKTNALGDTLWTKTYGGSADENCNSVQQTSDGGYILFTERVFFSSDYWKVWLIKTNETGDTNWTKIIGGNKHYFVQSGIELIGEGYIFVGYHKTSAAGPEDIWVVKTDATGDTIWTKTYGATDRDLGNQIKQTADGGYIIAASTRSFGAGDNDCWLIRTNSSGDTLWTKTFGGTEADFCSSVWQTSDNGFILVGGTRSFGIANGNYDIWLIKTNAAGDTLWTKTFGGVENDGAFSVQQTVDEGYILVGYKGIDIFNNDVWLIKTDESGNTIWAATYGGIYWDYGRSVEQTNDGGYIVGGEYYSTGTNSYDFYLIKVSPDPSYVNQPSLISIPKSFFIHQNYPNPFNPSTTIKYQIPELSFVTIKVFDVLGNEIETLVSEEKPSGTYEITWYAENLPSGVYFYRLQAGDFIQTKKMVLMK
jgi:hypothetical protein